MAIARLKLHHFPMTRSARVKWMLHEVVGDAFDVVAVDLYAGGQHRPEFLALNPNHAVPVLEVVWDDGAERRLIESGSIVNFLADAYPEKGLAPPADASAERADFLQTLHFASTWMDMMLWQIRVHEHLLPPETRDAKTIERYRAKFADEVEPQLKKRLRAHPYICGDAFSAADCVMGHTIGWARLYGLCQDETFSAYLSRLRDRPAYKSAFSDSQNFRADPRAPA